jgi:2-oxo-4-hydroxy-4-carboxy-5-ureidoimidazoline decarboxylase
MAYPLRISPAAITAIDAMDRDAFTSALGEVVEHSPWVAEQAWELRPFGSRERLALAFETVIRTAPPNQRMEVLSAHPDLAGREAAAGELSASSASEQRIAKLDRLSSQDLAALRELNRTYRGRFGFPFISCVREHSVDSLLAWGAARLQREPAEETATALAEVGKIIGLRLRERVRA